MHDTAFSIGTLAMNIYADLTSAKILEIGSLAVNGSLRDKLLPTTQYTGVDLEAGPGVDIVVEPGKPLPLEDDTYDFVMATSVFEHDPCFWMTFLEMCRKTKEGGYLYINAPSNGIVHRYPEDSWRFYPDSGKALAKWAISQGQAVTLVESFCADRENDIWNDFVAVFRKGRITKTLPKVFLHEHVASTNVLTWKSDEVINPRDETQDMLIARTANDRAVHAEGKLAEADGERVRALELDDQCRKLRAECESLEARLSEADKARDSLQMVESELRQRQEEIEQTRAEVARLRSERDAIGSKLGGAEERLAAEAAARDQLEAALAQWKSLQEREKARAADLQAANERLTRSYAEMERDLRDSEAGLAKLRAELGSDLEQARAEVKHVGARSAELQVANERLTRDRTELGDKLTASEARLNELRDKLGSDLQRANAELSDEKRAVQSGESKLAERYRELAVLTTMLRQREEENQNLLERLDWFASIQSNLKNHPRWWNLMPDSWRSERQHRRLQRLGLFDGPAYLERYPDVAAEGMDPLDHYLRHGIGEGRSRSF